ncbi:MAG: DUF2442 domain-containing protein [Bifidobacteriaceae bacterium]|nr:DUF2442 domain-containing protein [Bifidobacteriaceae bacterium]
MALPRVVDVRPAGGGRLLLEFDNGESRAFDVTPYIRGNWYGKLADPDYFNTAHVVDGGRTIAWAHGQDIAPHELYELSVAVKLHQTSPL